MPPVVAIEQTLLKAANGEDFSSEIDTPKDSCYKNDIEWSDLSRHLPLLKDVVRKATPDVKSVTSIQTAMCTKRCFFWHHNVFNLTAILNVWKETE